MLFMSATVLYTVSYKPSGIAAKISGTEEYRPKPCAASWPVPRPSHLLEAVEAEIIAVTRVRRNRGGRPIRVAGT